MREGLAVVRRREFEGWDWDDVLTRHRQRLTAGGDRTHARRCADDVRKQHGGGFEQMLAIVHDEQKVLIAQVGKHQCVRVGRRVVAQVECAHHGVAHHRGIPDVGELD